MATRMRSPNYPSMPLDQAIEIASKVYLTERTNAVDREVAAQAMGYSGITGRSAKVLSDLIQYGLLERAGKNEVRVSSRAVDILHPDSPHARVKALNEAASEPELFQRVKERFPDGHPSEAALKSFFLREGFADVAIAPARRAYLETVSFLMQQGAYESNGGLDGDRLESAPNQQVREGAEMPQPSQPRSSQPLTSPSHTAAPQSRVVTGPDIRWHDRKVFLGGALTNKSEAQEAIDAITAFMAMLPEVPKADDSTALN